MQTEQHEKIPIRNQYRTLWARKPGKRLIYEFWEQFQKDKLNPVLFYDGELPDFDAFHAWLTSADKDARFVVSRKGEIKALYWLNNAMGKSVMIHFCFLRKAFSEQHAIGQYVVRGLLECKNVRTEEYVLSALIGITPKPYRHALDFIQKLGFEIKGEIPEACWFARKNAYRDGVASILTRERIQSLYNHN